WPPLRSRQARVHAPPSAGQQFTLPLKSQLQVSAPVDQLSPGKWPTPASPKQVIRHEGAAAQIVRPVMSQLQPPPQAQPPMQSNCGGVSQTFGAHAGAHANADTTSRARAFMEQAAEQPMCRGPPEQWRGLPGPE